MTKRFIVPFKMEAYGQLLVEATTEAEAKEMLANVSCDDWDQDFTSWAMVPAGDPIVDMEFQPTVGMVQ